MPGKRSHLGIRSLLAFSLILHLAGIYQLFNPVNEAGILLASRKWMALGIACLLISLAELVLLILCLTRFVEKIEEGIIELNWRFSALGWLNVILYALGMALLTYLVYGAGWGISPPGSLTIAAMFWSASLAGSFLLKASSRQGLYLSTLPWAGFLGISVLLSAFVYRIASFLPDISTYPFTLTWSETSRYYYASLFFGKKLYGQSIPPTVLHPSRYLLQSIPFLLPASPLWLHRAWQVILWLGLSLLTSLTIVKRLSLQDRLWEWLSSLWIFLFLLVGPVYYHLQVPVILVCLGFNRREIRPPWKRNAVSLLSVILASAWVGISRVNWFPVPGLLAAALWLLEVSVVGKSRAEGAPDTPTPLRDVLFYLTKLAGWFLLGMGIAFLSQALYILWSGNPTAEFTSSFSSGLLWYRLWPNPTFLIGILPATLLLSLPLFWLTGLRLVEERHSRRFWHSIHIIRLLGIKSILLVLFLAGLVVSVKIGGGSNLHNMDAYLVLLLVTSTWFFFRRVYPDESFGSENHPFYEPINVAVDKGNRGVLAFALMMVVLFNILGRAPVSPLPDQITVEKALKEINRNIEKARQAGGEILFISNRHLITFKLVNGVDLVPAYERVYLMEMAMAGNSEYLERFHNDLRAHRFALIISEPLFLRQKDESEIFGEENNAWVQNVSRFVLCYYNDENRARTVNIQFFTPKSIVGDCP